MLVFGRQSNGSVLLFFSLLLGFGLSGCSRSDTVQEAVGYEQAGPDELAVIKRPPLILPPDYNLRPPEPGQVQGGGNVASEAARRALIGSSSSANGPALESKSNAEARAILVGKGAELVGKGGDLEAKSSGTSEGQDLLVSRTNRVERDLDELSGTRSESRVENALLQDILAFDPDEEAVSGEESAAIVKVIQRQQTSLLPETSQE